LTRATAIGASAGHSADISGSIVVLFSGITINALMRRGMISSPRSPSI
jgi:hypothetical protein